MKQILFKQNEANPVQAGLGRKAKTQEQATVKESKNYTEMKKYQTLQQAWSKVRKLG